MKCIQVALALAAALALVGPLARATLPRDQFTPEFFQSKSYCKYMNQAYYCTMCCNKFGFKGNMRKGGLFSSMIGCHCDKLKKSA